MGLDFTYNFGQTPLDPNEKSDLIPNHITTMEELNEWERENILIAYQWVSKKKNDPLKIEFIQKLHRHMFDKTWKWAGTFRLSDKNIGVTKLQILPQLKQFVENTKFWIEKDTFSDPELAAQVHHKLVWIHPFPNGNGRLARLYTDYLMQFLHKKIPSWGMNLDKPKDLIRNDYINGLREADKNNFSNLTNFLFS